ncbi:cysteine hydrolase family protein [Alteribacillus iranensis]|uniref:Nicotinamidase-related amidase n=1 Tax=Alteribacillus iranensis TaxID=930128 RepID=A0A1I2D4Y1_9BACI|nr:cysteine hydrolase family protein [Alteribacillus iranensis]SFE75607.1 Nicotinamidase-related amidase [Alteribacillus iranensis]
MSTALIIVDIQNDYFPNGKMELSQPEAAAANAGKLLDHFRKNNDPVFHVQHLAQDEGLGFFLPNTEGADIHKAVKPLEQETVITKHAPNSFFQTDLDHKLEENGVTKVVICGMMTHMCIDATVRSAVEHGYDSTLVEDACATLDLTYEDKVVRAEDVQAAFVGAIHSMYAPVVSTDDYLQTPTNA